MKNLNSIAQQLVAEGKGILAADESVGTMAKRLTPIGVESTLENRSLWREILFTADGIEKYISGVILFDETLREKTPGGYIVAELLKSKGIVPGIKVDAGTVALPGYGEDTFTQGLDKLGKRLEEYAGMGAQFAKWRAVYTMTPSDAALTANAVGLAEYAALVQQAGMVPIVEPEVLVLSGSHGLSKAKDVTRKALTTVFDKLKKYKVDLTSILLKPNMVLPSKDNLEQMNPEDIATETISLLKETVPSEVPGVVFLSGGLNPEQSTNYLSLMNKLFSGALPWQVSYSYGRALQQEALKAWEGKKEQAPAAQKAFLERAQNVSNARFGR